MNVKDKKERGFNLMEQNTLFAPYSLRTRHPKFRNRHLQNTQYTKPDS